MSEPLLAAAEQSDQTEAPVGRVIKQEANFYSVALNEQVLLCTMRANLKKAGESIRVGDKVLLDCLQDERPVITEILPRSSELDKPAVANVDQVVVVMSCLQPDFNPMLVDRLLLAIAYEKLQPILCISKADLLDEDLLDWIAEEYAAFPLFFISALEDEGLEELREQLLGHVSVLAGASGTGKSSLLNALNPEIQLVTGDVNQKMGTGKHTTRHVSLHKIEAGGRVGWLADSPGFSALELPPLERPELAQYYPEFLPWLSQCGFADCLHQHEENCGIKANFDTDSERYYNYLRLLEEVRERYLQRRDSASKEGLTKRAVGKNNQEKVIKLGTEGRARSRRTQKQMIEQIGNWTELDEDTLEELNPDEWRI